MTTATETGQVFLLPDLGEGLTEAEVVRWLVAVGDDVTVDQPIAEVETAKSLVEVPSPYAGRVAVLHGAEGETLDVGTPLITVEVATGPTDEAELYREEEKAGSGNVLIGYGTPEAGGSRRRRRPRAVTAPAAAAPVASPPPSGRRRPPRVVSPLVRRIAAEAGVDLHALTPTGYGGIIVRADVERAIAAPLPADAPETLGRVSGGGERIPLNGFRKAVSAALSRSRSEIPEATVWVDVDATPLWELREGSRTATDPGPGILAYLARFVVAALKEYPVLNSRLDVEREEIVLSDTVGLGIAVQSERGLVVPAVLGAESMTTSGLDAAIRDLTARAREGRATAEEMAGGTFTLNNYGGFNVDGSAAIINHPQVAILGLGRIIDRPWVVDGEIVVRKITQMSFVFDHRVCDGGTAAGFMRSVADAIEDPASAIARL
ncbi:dihydrolipoamide acetyltransferase family protein [Nocardioides sp. 503]|uniref:dihydrolipoamide acetyltransferase family protein n=1 Tax=Nocardioides sp. 503 TaxID=2508326 RepID=UPI00106F37A8|nr:dihydrolipoamide acetyltransferase family protein [Nocardioides sp. 503]